MTDAEIKKALECCARLDYSSKDCDICENECPYKMNCYNPQTNIHFLKDVIDLINRQQAKIERLEAEKYIACSLIPVRDCGKIETKMKMFLQTIASIENAAIREYIENLKKRKHQSSDWSHGEHPFVVEESDIDEVYAEMLGENNV